MMSSSSVGSTARSPNRAIACSWLHTCMTDTGRPIAATSCAIASERARAHRVAELQLLEEILACHAFSAPSARAESREGRERRNHALCFAAAISPRTSSAMRSAFAPETSRI